MFVNLSNENQLEDLESKLVLALVPHIALFSQFYQIPHNARYGELSPLFRV